MAGAKRRTKSSATQALKDPFLSYADELAEYLPAYWSKKIPQFLLIVDQAKALKIRDDFFTGDPLQKPDDIQTAFLVRAAVIFYLVGRFYEGLIEEQTAAKNLPAALDRVLRKRGSLRDTRPEKIAEKVTRGELVRYSKKPEKIADQALGFACYEIFQHFSVGSNRRRGGWDSYYKRESRPSSRKPAQDPKSIRRPASIQKIFLRVLLIADPERLLPDAPVDRRPPKPGFYTWLKQLYGRNNKLHRAS